MPASIAVVGPGKVGSVLGRLWVQGGLRLLGFHGRSPAASARASAFAGGGLVLPELVAVRPATAVALAVPDAEIPALVARARESGAVRPCTLWFHCSGRHGLEILQPLQALGARIGALHPVCPVPDASQGVELMPGRSACLLGEPSALRLLVVLARRAGMLPFVDPGFDRELYHAACALAANGLTALFAAAQELLTRAAPKAENPRELAELVASLMVPALQLCSRRGAEEALSGPVRRGDAATVQAHQQALAKHSPESLALYRVLMRKALLLAKARGLSSPQLAAVARALADGGAW